MAAAPRVVRLPGHNLYFLMKNAYIWGMAADLLYSSYILDGVPMPLSPARMLRECTAQPPLEPDGDPETLADEHLDPAPDSFSFEESAIEEYAVAVEEGATWVRLGTVLFGERPKVKAVRATVGDDDGTAGGGLDSYSGAGPTVRILD